MAQLSHSAIEQFSNNMQSPRLAGRYAKSLIDLAQERGELETVYKDMQYLQQVVKQSRDFVTLIKSPVIKADKKNAILDAVSKDKVSQMTMGFNRLLVSKGREAVLPEIVNAFIDQYNVIKGIHRVKLTTAVEPSEELKRSITQKMETEAGLGQVELETKVDPAIVGGFILEFNNNKVDASILRDLKDIRKQFMDNHYVQRIR
jgi:F-type H+-transporting ATPase subunit delta